MSSRGWPLFCDADQAYLDGHQYLATTISGLLPSHTPHEDASFAGVSLSSSRSLASLEHPPGAMVHAFLIHTLRAPNLEDTGLCRVLYSCVFGAEKSPDDPRPHGAERDRLFRKEQILAVAR